MQVWVGHLKEALEWRHEEKFEGMGQFKSKVHLRAGLSPVCSAQLNKANQTPEMSVRSQGHVEPCYYVAAGAQREVSRMPGTAIAPTTW